MSSGGGGSKSTTVQRSDPWSGQQPYLQDIYKRAGNLPQQQYYPGQTVVPYSQFTTDTAGAMYNRGVQGSPDIAQARAAQAGTAGLSGYLGGGAMGAPGFNEIWPMLNTQSAQQDISALRTPQASSAFAQNQANILANGSPAFNELSAFNPMGPVAGQAAVLGQGAWGLTGTPELAGISGANPANMQLMDYFSRIGALGDTGAQWNNIAQDITGRVNQAASMVGRQGSGAWAGNLGQQLGLAGNQYLSDLQNRMLSQRGLQQQAAGDVFQQGLQQAGLRANILQGLNAQDIAARQSAAGLAQNAAGQRIGILQNLDAQDLARRSAAIQAMQGAGASDLARQQAAAQLALTQQGQQVSGLQNLMAQDLARRQAGIGGFGQIAQGAPSLAAQDYIDLAARLQAGGMGEQKAQEYIQDAVNRWNFSQQAPYNQLQAMSGIIQGGNPGGTTTTTSPNPNQGNPIAGIIGGATSGAGLASALKLTGPWGWGLAGLGGVLGGFGG